MSADKGRATVVMNTSDYNEKVNDLLNDNTTYKEIRNDPTSVIERKLRDLVQIFKKN